jgi:hypothetical protein
MTVNLKAMFSRIPSVSLGALGSALLLGYGVSLPEYFIGGARLPVARWVLSGVLLIAWPFAILILGPLVAIFRPVRPPMLSLFSQKRFIIACLITGAAAAVIGSSFFWKFDLIYELFWLAVGGLCGVVGAVIAIALSPPEERESLGRSSLI